MDQSTQGRGDEVGTFLIDLPCYVFSRGKYTLPICGSAHLQVAYPWFQK